MIGGLVAGVVLGVSWRQFHLRNSNLMYLKPIAFYRLLADIRCPLPEIPFTWNIISNLYLCILRHIGLLEADEDKAHNYWHYWHHSQLLALLAQLSTIGTISTTHHYWHY